MSLPGPARTLVKPIIALYSQNQSLANLRHTSSATHAGGSWLEEMHWLVETDTRPVSVAPTARQQMALYRYGLL
jgi:hypothetical protein